MFRSISGLPHPTTPRPLIMVVCESVPTKLSGYSTPFVSNTTRAKYSRFTWCTIPEPGGTINILRRACAPHCKYERQIRRFKILQSYRHGTTSQILSIKYVFFNVFICCFNVPGIYSFIYYYSGLPT